MSSEESLHRMEISDPERSSTIHELAKKLHNSSDGLKIVVAGFISNFIVFGIAFSFGVFQEHYTAAGGQLSMYPDSQVAMIGTAASALTYMGGIFNKTLLFYFSPRTVMLSGGLMMALGLILGGLSSVMYQFVLSQGILFGIGSSFLYMPPVVCAPMFFNKNRAIAMGVLFSGTGFGGLAMATLSKYLISKFGWKWCLRIEGFMTLACALIAASLVKVPKNVSGQFQFNSRQILTLSQLKSCRVWMQLSASLLQSAGYLIPLFFMSKFGMTLGFSDSQGATFIGLNNVINAIFKIILGFVADKIGRLNMILVCSFISSVTIFTLWLIASRETFISFIVLYGVFSGAIISLLPTCLVELFGAENYQAMSGLMYFSRGVGTLLGSPLAGLLITNSGLKSTDYKKSIIYNGVLLLSSTVCLSILKVQDKWIKNYT